MGENAWYMVGANRWYIVGENCWYIVGENTRYTFGANCWYILTREVTCRGRNTRVGHTINIAQLASGPILTSNPIGRSEVWYSVSRLLLKSPHGS